MLILYSMLMMLIIIKCHLMFLQIFSLFLVLPTLRYVLVSNDRFFYFFKRTKAKFIDKIA